MSRVAVRQWGGVFGGDSSAVVIAAAAAAPSCANAVAIQGGSLCGGAPADLRLSSRYNKYC